MPDFLLASIPFLLFLALIAGLWLILAYLLPALVNPAHRLARALTRRIVKLTGLEWLLAHATRRIPRWRIYLPVVIVLIAGVLASFAAGAVFVELAEELTDDDGELQAVDERVYSWARDLQTEPVTPFFTALTILGTPVGLGIIVVIVSILLAVKQRYLWMVYLVGTTAVGGGINKLLKAWFARARPELAEMLRETTGHSFPSGHAMGSALVFTALAYLALRYFRNRNARALSVAICVSMILAISFSRIYLGVHWMSDIVSGIAAGTTWVFATAAGFEVFRRARRIRGHEPGSGTDRLDPV